MENDLGGTKPPADKFPKGNIIIPMTVVTKDNVAQISAWGTPEAIDPLPYGKSQSFKVTSSK
jgi:ribose transport system substrate-binding protein/ribose transport system permease protein